MDVRLVYYLLLYEKYKVMTEKKKSIWPQWDSSPKNVINVFPKLYDFCETQKKGE